MVVAAGSAAARGTATNRDDGFRDIDGNTAIGVTGVIGAIGAMGGTATTGATDAMGAIRAIKADGAIPGAATDA